MALLNYQKKSLLWDQVKKEETDLTNARVNNCFHCFYPLTTAGYFFGRQDLATKAPKSVVDYFKKAFPLIGQEKLLDLPFATRRKKINYFGKVCCFQCGLAYLIENNMPEEYKTIIVNQALSKGLDIHKFAAPSSRFFHIAGNRSEAFDSSKSVKTTLTSSLFQADKVVQEPMTLTKTLNIEGKKEMMERRFGDHLSDAKTINVLSRLEEGAEEKEEGKSQKKTNEEPASSASKETPKPKKNKKAKTKGHKWKF